MTNTIMRGGPDGPVLSCADCHAQLHVGYLEDGHRCKPILEERAGTVNYLRHMAEVYDAQQCAEDDYTAIAVRALADEIERGAHRRG